MLGHPRWIVDESPLGIHWILRTADESRVTVECSGKYRMSWRATKENTGENSREQQREYQKDCQWEHRSEHQEHQRKRQGRTPKEKPNKGTRCHMIIYSEFRISTIREVPCVCTRHGVRRCPLHLKFNLQVLIDAFTRREVLEDALNCFKKSWRTNEWLKSFRKLIIRIAKTLNSTGYPSRLKLQVP